MRQISWVPLIVVALLALLSFWLGKVAGSQAPGGSGGFTHDPDYIVENFAAMTFNEQGLPRYRLSARRMVHYMDDDTTELDQPRFSREADAAAPVGVRADRGLISTNGEDVYFIGDVRVSRPAAKGQAATELTADYIRVIPDADIVRTDKAVVMRQGKSVVEASGMLLDGNKRVMQLSGRVKATYEKRH
jgi:lipopolysaccharide export system protein LptC